MQVAVLCHNHNDVHPVRQQFSPIIANDYLTQKSSTRAIPLICVTE
jgi:hypothetical protein